MNSKFSSVVDSFDSEIFGFKCSKVTHFPKLEYLTAASELVEDLVRQNISYCTARVKADNFSIIHSLEAVGFYIVDVVIALEKSVDNSDEDDVSQNIRQANASDIESLKRLANAFKVTRYFNDPYLPVEKSRLIYERWIENSVNGKVADDVLVYFENENLLGFVTLQNEGHIPLIAVGEIAQGKGIGKELIKAGLRKLSAGVCKRVKIETQIQNIAAVRTYQSCGFKIVNSFITLGFVNDKIKPLQE